MNQTTASAPGKLMLFGEHAVVHGYPCIVTAVDQRIDVTTKSDFSSRFGFGSSSAVTVAFAKALTILYGIELSKKELFNLCYRAVLDVQGVGSGFDIASAIWGGTIYYIPPAKVVRAVDIDSIPLVVGYTGIKADTPTLIRMVQQMYAAEPARVEKIFIGMEQITNKA